MPKFDLKFKLMLRKADIVLKSPNNFKTNKQPKLTLLVISFMLSLIWKRKPR